MKRAWKMHFSAPSQWNEMGFVHQRIIFQGKKLSTFSHLLTVRLGAVTPLPPLPGRKIPIVFLYAFPYDQGNNLKCFNSNQSDADKQGNWKVSFDSCLHLVAAICVTPGGVDHYLVNAQSIFGPYFVIVGQCSMNICLINILSIFFFSLSIFGCNHLCHRWA